MNPISLRTTFLAILMLGLAFPGFSQEEGPSKKEQRKARRALIKASTDHYLVRGTSLNWITIQDARATNHIYGSPGAGIQVAQIDRRPGVIEYSDFINLQYGYMRNLEAGSDGHLARFGGGYGQVRELANATPWSTFLGAGVYGQYNGKFLPSLNNSLYHHEITAALRARFELEREFRLWRQNLIFQYRIQLPLVTYLNRWPEFGLSISGGSNYVAPIGEWNQVISEVSLEGWLSDRNDNRWRVTYQWDYSNFLENTHRIQTAAHVLTFAYLIHK